MFPDWLQGLLVGGLFLIAGVYSFNKLYGPLKIISLAFIIAGAMFLLGIITVDMISELMI